MSDINYTQLDIAGQTLTMRKASRVEKGSRRNDGKRLHAKDAWQRHADSVAAGGDGLVYCHISHRLSDKPARVTVYENLAVVSQGAIDSPRKPSKPAKRGKVQGFSAGSRRRMLRFFAMMRQPFPDVLPVLLTLTYPGRANFDNHNSKWKRDLDTFLKRLKRKFPDCMAVWRMEIKPRLSGELQGVEVPHFHIILFTPFRHDVLVAMGFLDWLSEAWFEVVGTGDSAHLKAGTNVKRVQSFKHLMYYVSKYVAKHDATTTHTGRVWGKVGDFDITPHRVHYIMPEMFGMFRARMVKYFEELGKKDMAYWLRISPSITLYGAGRAGVNEDYPDIARIVLA